MTDHPFAISFSHLTPGAETCSGALIEQEPWGKDVGETSQSQAIEAIAALMYGGRWPGAHCGGVDGQFKATVYVYTCDFQLGYKVGVSHGRVVGGSIEFPIREETVQCSMKLEHELDYPTWSVLSINWLGKCYDINGNITSRPKVTVVANKIFLSDKVYATLRLRYMVLRRIYYVTVNKRTTALENTYQSVAYCVWAGGVVWLDIKAPTNFEETDGECQNGAWYDKYGNMTYVSGMHTCDEDKYSIPVATNADKLIDVEYCSQVSDDPTYVDDVDWEEKTKEDCD